MPEPLDVEFDTPVGPLWLLPVAASVTAAAIGAAYGGFGAVNPIILYAGFLLPVLTGAVISALTVQIAGALGIGEGRRVVGAALLAAAVGYYCQWVAYLAVAADVVAPLPWDLAEAIRWTLQHLALDMTIGMHDVRIEGTERLVLWILEALLWFSATWGVAAADWRLSDVASLISDVFAPRRGIGNRTRRRR